MYCKDLDPKEAIFLIIRHERSVNYVESPALFHKEQTALCIT